jgi:hypothetical protein
MSPFPPCAIFTLKTTASMYCETLKRLQDMMQLNSKVSHSTQAAKNYGQGHWFSFSYIKLHLQLWTHSSGWQSWNKLTAGYWSLLLMPQTITVHCIICNWATTGNKQTRFSLHFHLVYDTMQSGRCVPTFWRNLLPPSLFLLHLWYWQQVSLKRWYLHAKLYGVTTKGNVVLLITITT